MPRKFSLIRKAQIAWRAIFDPRTPLSAKGILLLGLLYGAFPIDFVPDLLPLIGVVDDAGVLFAALIAFLHLSKHVRKALHENSL